MFNTCCCDDSSLDKPLRINDNDIIDTDNYRISKNSVINTPTNPKKIIENYNNTSQPIDNNLNAIHDEYVKV